MLPLILRSCWAAGWGLAASGSAGAGPRARVENGFENQLILGWEAFLLAAGIIRGSHAKQTKASSVPCSRVLVPE